MRSVILALTLALSACAPVPGDLYVVGVAPEFSPYQAGQVAQALDGWRAVVPVRFYLDPDACASSEDYTICVRPHLFDCSAAPCVVGREPESGGQGHADAYVDVSGRWDLRQITAHELGHAMGLKHLPSGAVMCWIDTCGAPLPTAIDAEAWRAIR